MSRVLIFVLAVFTVAGMLATVGYLLYEVSAFLKRKFSKARDTSAINNPFEEISARVLLAVFVVSSAVIVWMERYKFDHVNLENGESYPVRVNRLTGNTQVLYRGVWKPSSEMPNLPPLIQKLGVQDLEKLKGEAKLETELPYFNLTLYNGSDFTLKEITVEIVIKDSSGKEVLQRAYRIEQQHPRNKERDYSQSLGFHLGPQQTLGWKILAAKGIKL